MKPKLLSFLISFPLTALMAASAFAQGIIPTAVNDQNRSGELPFSTSVGTDVEHVDIGSGDLLVHIPFVSVKGRGTDYTYFLRYSGHYWTTNTSYGDAGYTQNWALAEGQGTPGLGWHDSASDFTFAIVQGNCYPNVATYRTSYIYTDPNGGKHPLAAQSTQKGTCSVHDSGPDLTGQGMLPNQTVAWSSIYTITEADGRSYAPSTLSPIGTSTGTWTDANGNINGDGAGTLDTLGRTLVTQQSGTNQITYSLYDSNGVLRTYTVNISTVTLNTNFNVIGDYNTHVLESSGSAGVASSIVLPNNQSYQFQYENGTYGGLTQITLPTGGSVTYTWATFLDGARTYRYVASRTVNVGGHNYTWNFARSGTEPNISVDVTDPLNNHTVYTVYQGAATSAKFYQGAATGNPLRQHVIDYDWDTDPWFSSASPPGYQVQNVGMRPIRITTTLDNGQVSKKEFDYETFDYTYHPCLDDSCGGLYIGGFTTSRGNVTEIREFDWGAVPSSYGSGTPGSLMRRTDRTYLHNSNSNYLTYNIVDKVLQKTVYDGAGNQIAQTQYEYDNYVAGDNPMTVTTGAPQHDYTGHSSSFTYRGNATRVKRWRNTDGALLPITYTYDDLGNIRAIKDPLGHTTTYSYTDSWANTSCPPPSNSLAYVTQVTNALSQNVQVTYEQCTGLVQAQKDQNDINASRAGTTYTYDLLGRPTQKNNPDGGQVATAYNDVPPVSATSTIKINSTQNLVTAIIEDGLGRTTQSQTTSGPLGTVSTDTVYDGLGRVLSVSNPHASGSSPTDGITTYVYDALGRICVVVPPDGTAVAGGTCPATQPTNDVFTRYSGNTTTATDQAGKSRKSVSDGLGRLTQVFEDPSSLNYETDYQYDTLGNFLCAVQKGTDITAFTTCAAAPTTWRPRSFSYNSLSQLLTASNPESGTITYAYNSDGTLATKIAPAPNQTGTTTVTSTYSYDALHRMTQKSFSDTTPTVKYGYDAIAPAGCTLPTLTINNGIGKRTGMCDAAGAEAWSYDITANVGWKVTDARTTNSVPKSAIVQNNLVGSPASLTYPSSRTITYSFDAASRPVSAIDSTGPINYATAAAYAPTGALSSFTNGASIVSTLYYNNRLQPCRISVKFSGTAPSTCTDAATGNVLDFTYCFNSNMSDPDRAAHNCGASTTLNNGNVAQIANNQTTARTQNFKYDSLNRIQSAYTEATTGQYCWDESMGYDPWGNLLSIGRISGYTCSNEELLSVSATTNNQVSGNTYDAAGNLITIPSIATYTYNAENQLTATAGVTYTYDGDGKRVQKSSGKLYWYGMGSDPLDETDLAGNTSNASFNEYIFFGGKRIARRDYQNNVNYYFADHLGTARIVANSSGTPVDDSDFYPFGGERVYLNSSPQNYKFTGKERDSESGLDYFGKRYLSSGMGRWTSPDPLMMKVDRLIDPQRLNLYAYVDNNPVTNKDPDGADLVSGSGDQKAIKSALKEIASRPGGREFLRKMDNLTQTIRLSTGTGMVDHDGRPTPGRTRAAEGDNRPITRTRDSSGKITDVTAPNLETTIDPKLGKDMRNSGDPNAPASDAELLGHELKHAEHQDFKLPDSETGATQEIDDILKEPVDKDLKKSADQFVDDLLKPNAQNSQQQQPPTPPAEKKKDPE